MALRDMLRRLVVTPKANAAQAARLAKRGLRPGMWVVHNKGSPNSEVGILVREIDPVSIEVMLVDGFTGQNRLSIVTSPEVVRQAEYREIPKMRRPAQNRANAMGYV